MISLSNSVPEIGTGPAPNGEVLPIYTEPLIVLARSSRLGRVRTIGFQWHDGAGEMHYWMLSPEESAEYLRLLS